jgi:hypothetical protein
MDVHKLVTALLAGDLLIARQCVADALRAGVQWEQLARPADLSPREMSVAAGVIELLATRSGGTPPAWTKTIGGLAEAIVLDPGLEQMPRSFERARTAGPESLRRRNIVALPDFLDVA